MSLHVARSQPASTSLLKCVSDPLRDKFIEDQESTASTVHVLSG